MKIYTASQVQDWDRFTMENEPISSLDLMERASGVFTDWFCNFVTEDQKVTVVSGPGNNGGDGLAVARLLFEKGYQVRVFRCLMGSASSDHMAQLKKLPEDIQIESLEEGDPLPTFSTTTIIIDAIFGSGLSRPVSGYWGQLVEAMNSSEHIYAIDIPSGVFSEPKEVHIAVKTLRTLSFQTVKLSFLCPEYANYIGDWTVKSIGLHPGYTAQVSSVNHYSELSNICPLLKKRSTFAHKGDFGHGLLVAGSRGMIGASLLSGRAALHAGLGLLTIHSVEEAYPILQSQLPEAMIRIDSDPQKITQLHPTPDKFQALAIGPGLGQANETQAVVRQILSKAHVPLILDADALNSIAKQDLLQNIPPGSILTPHPGEFDRLFGKHNTHFDRIQTASAQAKKLGIVIVLKGAYTLIASPDGHRYFNSTGNPGMATGGSGDTLTGIILGLRCQGYSALDSARIAVFIHGLAGDLALQKSTVESILPSHLIDELGLAFRSVRNGPSGRSSSPS